MQPLCLDRYSTLIRDSDDHPMTTRMALVHSLDMTRVLVQIEEKVMVHQIKLINRVLQHEQHIQCCSFSLVHLAFWCTGCYASVS